MRSTSQYLADSNERRICIANIFSANNDGLYCRHDESIDWRTVLVAYDRIGSKTCVAKAKEDAPVKLFERLFSTLKCTALSMFKSQLSKQEC